jgi:uncharacterized protein involved in outer membrane biogenesis
MRRILLVAAIVLLVLAAAVTFLLNRLLDPDTVRGALENQASAAIGQPVRMAAVEWAVLGRPRLVLSGIQIGEPTAITLNRVELTTGLRPLLSKRVEGAGIVVSGSQIALPLPIAFGGDAAAGPAAAAESASAASAFTIASIDRISLEDIELVAQGRRLRLDVESSLDGDRLQVSTLRLQSDATRVSGSGELGSVRERRGAFSVAADPLDLDELLAIASGLSGPRPAAASKPATTESAGAASQPPLDVRVDIQAPRGRIVGVDFAKLATTLTLARGGVTLEPFSVGVFDGTITGRLHLDTTGATPRASLSAELGGMDAAQLAAFAGSTGVLTGRLGGQVTLEARGTEADAVFKSARGRAKVAIVDGTLPGLDLVGPAILAFGKPDLSQPQERSKAFSRLGGTFTLADGVLQSNDLAMASRDVDLSGRGTLRVAGAVTDVRANLVLSEALSAQAGRDLYRYAREGSRVVLPATVAGPLSAPSVSIDLGAAAGRAFRNELQDQARKALERLRKR